MRDQLVVQGVLTCVLAIGNGVTVLAQAAGEDLPLATVRIKAFDPFGQEIKNPSVYLYTLDRKQDLAKGLQGATIRRVPYGWYILVVSSSGGGVGQRLVAVNTKELWLRIGVSMPAGDALWPSGDLTVRGDIKPTPQNLRNWWVRVEGVFLPASREAPIQKGGTFSVGGLEMGTYLVQIFEGSKPRHVQAIEIDPNQQVTHLTISLAK